MKFEKGNAEGRKKRTSLKTQKAEAFALGRKIRGNAELIYTRLIQILKDEDPVVAMSAIKVLLDRGWGKPKESIEFSGEHGGPLQIKFEVQMKQPKVIDISGDQPSIRAIPKAINGAH